MTEVRRLSPDDLPRLRRFWNEHWGGDFMVAHGVIYHPEQLDGFLAEDGGEWLGLLTYYINDDECEVTSLNSLREGRGIGSMLLTLAVEEARARACRRIFLITTNDNLNALGFYQRRGFELVKINRNALAETRKLKPQVPLIGMNNIPLRDEIELEMILR